MWEEVGDMVTAPAHPGVIAGARRGDSPCGARGQLGTGSRYRLRTTDETSKHIDDSEVIELQIWERSEDGCFGVGLELKYPLYE